VKIWGMSIQVPTFRSLSLAVILLLSGALARADGSWLGSAWRFRVPVTVAVGTYDRLDMPAEVQLNFTQLMASFGFSGTYVENSLRVVEVNGSGTIIDTAVAFQFDKDSDYNASSKASGQLIIIAKGTTTAGTIRNYHVYFNGGTDSFPAAQVTQLVTLTDGVIDAGQSSFRIQATGATYYYHKLGAGFSSLVDASGNDWLGYDPTPGSAGDGEYRGTPNARLGTTGQAFHPGYTFCTSNVVHSGPVKATFRSISTDGNWECYWEIYPRFARMTMTKAAGNYWYLYEGTPGGGTDPSTLFMYRSDGTQTYLNQSWTGDIATNEWVYFSNPNEVSGGRSMFVVHNEDDTATDIYWPMYPPTWTGHMTVFGFGRDGSDNALLSGVPQHFTMGLMDGTQFAQCSKLVYGSYKPMTVSAGSPEQQLTAPQALYPASGSTGLPSTVSLAWARLAGATSYHVQAGLDSTFASGLVIDNSSIIDSTVVLNNLRAGAVYFWRVQATVSGTLGPWSATQNFTTALSAPTLSDPSNGATLTSLTPTIRWRSVAWAQAYGLQVSTDSTFAGGYVVNEWNSGDTSRVLPQLSESTTYFWRARARTEQVTSSFSGVWHFRTNQVLVAPNPIQPPNSASGLSTAELFRWTKVAGAITYRLQVDPDSTFSSGFFKNDSTIVDTFRTVAGMAHGEHYYWRVQAKLAAGDGPFSPTWSFTTAYELPGQPILVSPAPGAHIASDSASFIWTKVQPGVTRYWLEVGLDSEFVFSLVDTSIVDTVGTSSIPVRTKWYWWRVRGENIGGWGPFSTVQSFYADELGAVRRENAIPTRLSLDQNYPNPFNPTTRIRFALPSEKQVRIEIYSVLGERIATLVNDRLSAGVYTVDVDGSRLSSGVYYYRLVAGETALTRKMLLVK
jgi:hypothetical protein